MSNRRSQLAPRSLQTADQVGARAGRLILSIIVLVIILIVAVAIRPALLADWTT